MKEIKDMTNAELVAHLWQKEGRTPIMTVGAMLESKMPPKPKVKKWMGSKPEVCELCKQPFKQQFVDGRTHFGYWALMCAKCHSEVGLGLGVGSGQRYDLNTLEKVGG